MNPAQKKAAKEMRLLFSRLSGLKKVPFPLHLHLLRLGLGISVGYCALPGRKLAIGFAKGSRILPVAIAEKNEIRPLPRLKNLVKKVETVVVRPDGQGGKTAQISDSFGNFLTLGKAKKEGEKWGLEGIRMPLPKCSLSSLSMPALLSTLFMGDYLPALLSGFPLVSPEESLPYHFLTQSFASAVSSMEKERKACEEFGLSTCGFEKAAHLALSSAYLREALWKLREGLGDKEVFHDPVSLSLQNGYWVFSSSLHEIQGSMDRLGSCLNLCRFASSLLPSPVGYYRFLDAMEEALKNPFSSSSFKSDKALMAFSSQKAKEASASSLDPGGEWDFRKAFFSISSLFRLPLAVEYSVCLSKPADKAALRLNVGKADLVPEFLAPHPLGRRYLIFLYSLSVAKALCAVIFGIDSSIKEVELFIESSPLNHPWAISSAFLAKGSFKREDFLREGNEKDAQAFFNARFAGAIVKGPYFSPLPSSPIPLSSIESGRRSWNSLLGGSDPSFVQPIHSAFPENSWDEVPKKFIAPLGTSFVADLSIERKRVLQKVCSTFDSLFRLVKEDKMSKARAIDEIRAICELLPDPELKQAGHLSGSLIEKGEGAPNFDFSLEGEVERAQEEAARLFSDRDTSAKAVQFLEEKVKRAETGFNLLPLAPSRYFGTYAERVIYNRLLASKGEYTVLLPRAIFSAHVELEEMISKFNGPGALEHANWQVVHAPATPLSHLNQYKELLRLQDLEAAQAAARNMLEVSVKNKHVAMAYRNLGYCFWMEGDLPMASACYRLAGAIDSSEDLIRTESWLLTKSARFSHTPLPDPGEVLGLLNDRSIPVYPDLPGIKVAKSAAEALVDFGLFIPAQNILSSLSTLPDEGILSLIASSLFA